MIYTLYKNKFLDYHSKILFFRCKKRKYKIKRQDLYCSKESCSKRIHKTFGVSIYSLIFLLPIMILFSCNSVLRYTEIPIEIIQQEEVFPDFNKTADALEFFRDYEILETVEISASYYGKKFNKKKTASGEIFDMNGISAAHYDYPFGTILRLTNISNNKQIIVKINDRTHKKSKRKIDLSLGAAKELDMIKEGIIKVKAEVLKWGKK